MALSPVYFHVSNDVAYCDNEVNTNNHIDLLESYCGFKFLKRYTRVKQGTRPTANDHLAVGLKFRDPIGGSSNYGGNVSFLAFKRHFDNVVRPELTRAAAKQPLFSIVDHNSAHHFSYALPYLMYKHMDSKPSRRKLLITFDNHTDQHGTFSRDRTISCGNYVRALFVDKVVDYVLHIGWDSNSNHDFRGSNLFDSKNFQKRTSRADNTSPCRIGVHRTLEQAVATTVDKGIRYVYITIDRDFMKGACTPYPDGECSPVDTARDAVETVITALSKEPVILVGMDVTGMPCSAGNTANLSGINVRTLKLTSRYAEIQNAKLRGDTGKAVKIAFQDVKYYYDLAQELASS